MEVLPLSDSSIQEAVKVLRAGGVVAHATETCYGLACDLGNAKAVEKLFAIKNRPTNQPVSALFDSIDQAQQYLEWNEDALLLATQHLPGPLTIILQQKLTTPTPIFVIPPPNPNPNPTVGVRISSHPTARRLAEAFGSPLSTTSANIHGKKNPYSAEDIGTQYARAQMVPDLIIDEGELSHEASSTVVDASHGAVDILREGGIGL
jgi:L-threonylcarbamoyladenylate synthase